MVATTLGGVIGPNLATPTGHLASAEVIASWNARTPPGTWIQIELRGRYSDGTDTPWYVMGRLTPSRSS